MIDNLRRSLFAPLALLALVVGWMLPLPGASWTMAVLAMLALPYLLRCPSRCCRAVPGSHRAAISKHLADTRLALARLRLT
jgi:cyclic beta-1,2-glucan synthetase